MMNEFEPEGPCRIEAGAIDLVAYPTVSFELTRSMFECCRDVGMGAMRNMEAKR